MLFPFQSHCQSAAAGGPCFLDCDSPSLAVASLVPPSPSASGSATGPPSSPPCVITAGPHLCPPTGPVSGVDCNEFIRRSFEVQGLSYDVAQFLLLSWRRSTLHQYRPYLSRWVSVCLRREIDPFLPPVNFLLDFLLSEFQRVPARSYSTMNTIRSALSTIARLDGQPAGQHPLVIRFMRAVFQERPAFSRCHFTWDPKLVLTYLKRLGPNDHLSLIQLSRKLAALLLLVSGQRGQVLRFLDTRNMSISDSMIVFRIGDLLKTSQPGSHISELCFARYSPDPLICVYTTIVAYLERTRVSRGSITGLLLTTKPPMKVASRDTLRRWVREVMGAAGIDLTLFSPHSTRSAASSKAALRLPLSSILLSVGWSRESTFARFYRRPIRTKGLFAQAVLAEVGSPL